MKRGEITTEQIAKLILAVAVILVLFTLLAKLFIPFFDRGDEIAKSYMKTLENQIDIANKGGVGEFFMYGFGEGDKEYYMVYFGNSLNVDFKTIRVYGRSNYDESGKPTLLPVEKEFSFNSLGNNKNRICVCSVEGIEPASNLGNDENLKENYEIICKHCEDLKHSAEFPEKNSPLWYEGGGNRTKIELIGDKYVFSRIK